MRSGKALALALLVSLLQAAPPAQAQCAGFTDVASGGFCGNVTWIKNRQITLGCGVGTTYCPNDPVTRLQMAAFMNRVGNVLTPLVLDVEDTGASLNLPMGPFHVCQTATIPAVQYPRTMHAQMSFSYQLSAVQEVTFGVVTSVNGGPFSGTPTGSLNGAGEHQHHFISPLATLGAGNSYQFAIIVARGGFQNNTMGFWQCQLQVHVVNAIGSL